MIVCPIPIYDVFKIVIHTVANLWAICPRHTGFGLANMSVASGQRDPSIGNSLSKSSAIMVEYYGRD